MVISSQDLEIAEIDYLEQNNNEKLNEIDSKILDSESKVIESENLNKEKKNKNIKKVSELAQVYSVVTQGFFMMIVVAAVGFAIGKWGMKSEVWAAIYAVIGALIGLVIFVSLLWRLKIGGLGSDKRDESKRDE